MSGSLCLFLYFEMLCKLWSIFIMIISFLAIAIFRWALLPTLAILIPVSVFLSWFNVTNTIVKNIRNGR
jgi:uncharacterized membrane protein YiaA